MLLHLPYKMATATYNDVVIISSLFSKTALFSLTWRGHYLLKEVGNVISAAAGPRERVAIVSQLSCHDARWFVSLVSTHIFRSVMHHPKTAATPNSRNVVTVLQTHKQTVSLHVLFHYFGVYF